jgi:hypothetical protein
VILELRGVNIDEAGHRFDAVGDRFVDARPVWPSILEDLFELNRRQFDSGGREGGVVAWKKDSPATLAEKARAHQDPRVMHRTRALRTAASEPNAPAQRVQMDPERLLLGIELPYAGIVAKRRPIFRVPRAVNESIAAKLLAFIDEGQV